MWSIFKTPLMEANGMTAAEVSLCYSVFFICVFLANASTGFVLKKVSQKTVLAVSSIGFALGWFMTGYAHTAFSVIFWYSIVGGISDGFIYNQTVAVALRWYPDRKGFANGVCIGAMGLSPVVFAPLGNALILNAGVYTAFKVCGLIFLALRLIFGMFIKDPPDDYVPKGWIGDEEKTNTLLNDRHIGIGGMFKQPIYYFLWFYMLCANVSGQMITGHAASIGTIMGGMTATQGASLVMFTAIGNFIGRFGFGWVSDKIGRFNTFYVLSALLAVCLLVVGRMVSSYVSFLVFIMWAGACFGGVMALAPALVSDLFGGKTFAGNWPFVYFGYTCASYIGPMVAAKFETTGTYIPAFNFAGVLAIVSLGAMIVVRILSKRMDEKYGDKVVR